MLPSQPVHALSISNEEQTAAVSRIKKIIKLGLKNHRPDGIAKISLFGHARTMRHNLIIDAAIGVSDQPTISLPEDVQSPDQPLANIPRQKNCRHVDGLRAVPSSQSKGLREFR